MAHTDESRAAVERWFREELGKLWPAGLGSLSLRRTRCMRRNCHACQTGEQHPSYVLYGKHDGRRSVIYVPDSLVLELQRVLRNGRAFQVLLYEAARRYALALKRERLRTR